jgi:hypothetical protein
MARQPPSHQARVDAIVSEFKTGRPGGGHGQSAESPAGVESLEIQLLELRADLAKLGGKLVDDLALIAAHPEIQMLDISVQRIDRMIGQLRDA